MIVVTTPTGQVGSRLVDHLLGEDEQVRVIVRDPSRLASELRERVDVVEGTHDDPDVLDAALDGAEAAFWLVPPDFGAEDARDHYRDFTRPFCEALSRHRVARVVGVTSAGRGDEHAGVLTAAFAMDDLIERTGVAYRALSMPSYMENFLGQVDAIRSGDLVGPHDADRPLAVVATRDIAAAAANLLCDRSWAGQEPVPVFGPDHLSPNQMAEVMTEVLGRPVSYQWIPVEGFEQHMRGLGASPGWASGMAEMILAQNRGIYDAEQQQAAPASTSFQQWCEDTLRPAVLD